MLQVDALSHVCYMSVADISPKQWKQSSTHGNQEASEVCFLKETSLTQGQAGQGQCCPATCTYNTPTIGTLYILELGSSSAIHIFNFERLKK